MDGVQRLVEQSLLRVSPAGPGRREVRFSYYLPLRDYALARLEESGREPATRKRHADHFRERATEWGGQVDASKGREALEALLAERENIRAAAEYWLARLPELPSRPRVSASRKTAALEPPGIRSAVYSKPAALGRIARATLQVNSRSEKEGLGSLQTSPVPLGETDREAAAEARSDFGQAVRESASSETQLLVRFVCAIEPLYWANGPYREYMQLLERCVQRTADTDPLRSLLLLRLGETRRMGHDLAVAAEDFARALALARDADQPDSLVGALNGLASVDLDRGRYATGRAYAEEAVRRASECSANVRVESLRILAWGLEKTGSLSDALARCDEARALARRLATMRGEAQVLLTQGAVFLELAHFECARQCFRDAQEVFRNLSATSRTWVAIGNLAFAYHIEGALEQALEAYEQARKGASAQGHVRGELRALGGSGIVHHELGHLEAAASRLDRAKTMAFEAGDIEVAVLLTAHRAFVDAEQGEMASAATILGSLRGALHGMDEPLRAALEIFETHLRWLLVRPSGA